MNKIILKKIKNKINSYLFGHKTFSQNGEDKNIECFFPLGYKINYLDLGANHPIRLSNTYLLYKNGGSGVCVDPDVRVLRWFKIFRQRDIALQLAVSLKDDGEEDFYFINDAALNTTKKVEADKCVKAGFKIVKTEKVKTRNINNLIEEYFTSKSRNLDFLNIDVEGIDEEILHSLNFNKHQPTVICIETGKFMDLGRDKKERVDKFMIEKNYQVIFYNLNNTIYIYKPYLNDFMNSLGVLV